ncbi:putative siderophore transport system permease protein YfhA [bacterium HR29]|jgi:iron complex transport system permease protein|nr:putative siderophore transport system permease protein YfhA [bacterium HR29]
MSSPSSSIRAAAEPRFGFAGSRGRAAAWLRLLLLTALLALVMMAAIGTGPLLFSPSEVVRALVSSHDSLAHTVVWDLRLPRVLLAVFVGANLAVSGALLQGVTRNPLADPYLLGISAGGVFAAVATLTVLPGIGPEWRAAVAFGGSLAAGGFTYLAAWKGGISPTRLILSGVALSSLLTAFTSTLLVTSTTSAQIAVSWLVGGFLGRGWDHFAWLWPYSAAGLSGALLASRHVNIIVLGDEVATSLGQRVERVRLLLVAVAALLAGSAVSVAGLIGFFGLAVPHIARFLFGSDYRLVIPASALLGALLMVVGDTAARTILDPRELPVGVLTAAMGAPFLLYLVRRRA